MPRVSPVVAALAAMVVATIGDVPASRAEDGAYVAESFGVASGAGRLAGFVGTPLHLRIGFGMRLGDIAIEPWILSDLQTDRDGAFQGVVGGDPRAGSADLNAMGLDARYIVDLHPHVALFARTGPLVAEGNGALAGYHGRGLGVAGGVQLTGRVRALGFLWAPLFFLKRGPMMTGALFVDAGYDFYFLRMAGAQDIDARVGHISLGFAVGSSF